MENMLLQIKNANKHFGASHVLKDVDFDIAKCEVHCLVGPNGCGKSTLIKIISGVHQPDAGTEIWFENNLIQKMSSSESMNIGIQVIYQDLSVFPNLTVAENIAFFFNVDKEKKNISKKLIYDTAKSVLAKMKVNLPLDELVERLPIASRQLVAIARALVTDARLIIMDEPTSSLTRAEVDVLFSVIRDLKKQAISIVFVSHKLNEIIEVADRVTVVRDGVKIGTYLKQDIDYNRLMYLVSGQNLHFIKPNDVTTDEIVLKVDNLTRAGEYSEVSFDLRKGEVLGIYGALGAGRTELALSLFGMTKPETGSILINGSKKVLKSNAQAISEGIAYVPEDRLLQGIVLEDSICDNICISIIKKVCDKIGLLVKRVMHSLSEDWSSKLNIVASGTDAKLSTMSGGNQQKVVLAKWLATTPKVLILDEPTNGVDVGAKSAIYEIVKEFASRGIAVILISSEVPEIYNNCNRVLIMKNGRITNEFPTDQITEEELNEYVG